MVLGPGRGRPVRKARVMFSRRDLLRGVLAVGPAAGGAALVASCPRWLEAAVAPQTLTIQDILRTAPKARYWTTFAMAGPDCSKCHTPGEDIGKPHAHDPKMVRCLLCAQGCTI